MSARLARGDDPRFSEVEEAAAVTLEFPEGRLASFVASFGVRSFSEYRLAGADGGLRLSPAYSYGADLALEIAAGEDVEQQHFTKRDQFAPELVHFSECIQGARDPEPDGYEGLADVRIIEAAYRAAELGQGLALRPLHKPRRPSAAQEITRPPVEEPPLVDASSPHRD